MMREDAFYFTCVVLLLGLVNHTAGQDCSVLISADQRRDCYPWQIDGSSDGRDKCTARGCIWCDQGDGSIACYYDDTVCPSTISESSRVDCHPEAGATKDACLSRGCAWCNPSTQDSPACFYDDSVNQGGEVCPSGFPESERIDCHPELGASAQACAARGCYWCEASSDAPWCFVPKERGYRMVGDPIETSNGLEFMLERVNYPSWYGEEMQDVILSIERQTEQRLNIKITDASAARFEVPVPIDGTEMTDDADTDYIFQWQTDPVFTFQVVRRSTGVTIFDTRIGGFMMSNQFLSIGTYLNTEKIYGLGEHEHNTMYHENNNFKVWPMWTRDAAVQCCGNLYGQIPFYVGLEEDNNAHGLLVLNSNAQEVEFIPAPGLVFRTIGGVLDMHFFMGPTVETVVQQYNMALGPPVMVPYWAFGFQLCRWGYKHLDEMKAAVDRMRYYDIPHDVQYGDIDYMDGYRDFTLDEENFGDLPEYIDHLKQEGTRFVKILDPGISIEHAGNYPAYDRGQEAGVWVTEPDGVTPYEGEVWPGAVYYPDFTKQVTEDWWTTECIDYHNDYFKYEGIWIDMNEPSSFVHGRPGINTCHNDPLNFPPYIPEILDRNLHEKTLCMEAMFEWGSHYNTHSLYGYSMSKQSLSAARAVFPGKRSVVFSRSTFPGTARYAQHWLGDNFSQWSNMRWSIIGMIEFNMFGMPYTGPDICGFLQDTTESLCQRWQQLGAFYPFSRNHNADGQIDQDPGQWASVAQVTRTSLMIRYTLLPYLYTLHHFAHTEGHTVVRGLFNEFTSDSNTHSITDQFLWGSGFMVSPVLDQGSTTVNAYFPDQRWYSWYDGAEVTSVEQYVEIDAPWDFIPLHVRGGSVLPTQQPANSTMTSRLLPMGVIVALDNDGEASGTLFWDDGEALDTYQNGNYFLTEYAVNNKQLSAAVQHDGYFTDSPLILDDVRVMGESTISEVELNGQAHGNWSQDSATNEIVISNIGVDVNTNFTVRWQ